MYYEDEWVEELVLENRLLRQENYKLQMELQESEKKHYDFIDEMFHNTQNATASWINVILSGGLEINTK